VLLQAVCYNRFRKESSVTKQRHNRTGKKITRSHGTVLAAAGIIADIAVTCDAVKKISLSFITGSRATRNALHRVKITRDGFALQVKVSDGSCHQTLYVHTSDMSAAATFIANEARQRGFHTMVLL
jgi:hypothetical protein